MGADYEKKETSLANLIRFVFTTFSIWNSSITYSGQKRENSK